MSLADTGRPAAARDPDFAPLVARAANLRARMQAFLADCTKKDRSRLALWTPVALGAGAALYFSLPLEPKAVAAPFLCVLFAAAWRFSKSPVHGAFAAAFFMALGFAAADLRTARVDAPAIEYEMRPKEITGRLLSVEEAPAFRRLIIAVETIENLDAAKTPAKVRVNWRGREFAASPGDRISLRAGLSPPPPPAAPGAFDFARHLYFQRIGAVGYAVTPPVVAESAALDLSARASRAVERTRLAIARRILESAPGEGGAIVAAVVTGKRAAITERAENALRDSGLAHLLAISGLHMGLATGLIFFAVRLGLAAIEPVALRYPIKKWAAGAALVSGFAYLLLSGGGWSARRAFIMTSIVFIAILVDRRGLSLRNVAIAATIILLASPEAVLHPGFQMSFAAVTALIAAYEWAAGRMDPDMSFSWLARLRRYIVGIGVTDTIAAVATAPFGLYHFNRAAIYSLAANIFAMPVMGFFAMPAAILALLLMPLGLDGWAWRLSAEGFQWIVDIGAWVASRPGAIFVSPQWPPAALAVVSLGGLWFCLMSARWRLFGLAALPAAALLIGAVSPPALFVSRDGDNVGVIPEGGEAIALAFPRKDSFAADVWKENVGLDPLGAPTISLADIGRCDALGCIVTRDGSSIAISFAQAGLADDCQRAALVIAVYAAPRGYGEKCRAQLIDKRNVWDGGAHAVWIGANGAVTVRSVRQAYGERPWSGFSR